jgi:hypothetical protein
MTERQKPDLSSIEPIGKLPDDESDRPIEEADRVGRGAVAIGNTAPAAGVGATTVDPGQPSGPSDEEQELDKLRR